MNESRGGSALEEAALTLLIYCRDFRYSVIQAPGHISADKRTCPQSNGSVKINIKASSMSLNTTGNFFRPHACSSELKRFKWCKKGIFSEKILQN